MSQNMFAVIHVIDRNDIYLAAYAAADPSNRIVLQNLIYFVIRETTQHIIFCQAEENLPETDDTLKVLLYTFMIEDLNRCLI